MNDTPLPQEEQEIEEVSHSQDTLKEYLSLFKGLNSERYSACEVRATERVREYLGQAPEEIKYLSRLGAAPSGNFTLKTGWREDILRLSKPQDYGSWILIVLFMLLSATHIIGYGAELANLGFHVQPDSFSGVRANREWSTIITQLVLVLSGEVGILYFFYRHMRQYLREDESTRPSSPLFYFSPNIFIAAIFAAITITANLYSMVAHIDADADNYWFWVISGIVIGVVVPIINVFLGERVTELLNEVELDREIRIERMRDSFNDYNRRRQEAIHEFNEDLKAYWHLHDNPHEFKVNSTNSYLSYLAAAIIAYYKQYHRKVKIEGQEIIFSAWTPTFEKMLAAREIAAASVNDDLEAQVESMKLVFTRRESSTQ